MLGCWFEAWTYMNEWSCSWAAEAYVQLQMLIYTFQAALELICKLHLTLHLHAVHTQLPCSLYPIARWNWEHTAKHSACERLTFQIVMFMSSILKTFSVLCALMNQSTCMIILVMLVLAQVLPVRCWPMQGFIIASSKPKDQQAISPDAEGAG